MKIMVIMVGKPCKEGRLKSQVFALENNTQLRKRKEGWLAD
jgi:hypothetical protein